MRPPRPNERRPANRLAANLSAGVRANRWHDARRPDRACARLERRQSGARARCRMADRSAAADARRSRRCSPPIRTLSACSTAWPKARRTSGTWRPRAAAAAALLQADPDQHLAALLAGARPQRRARKDEAEAMRLLRRMKAEAALLIALADIGGVWPVMRARAR